MKEGIYSSRQSLKPLVHYRRLREEEYDAFIEKALDLVLRAGSRRSTMDKIDLLEAAQDANGITEIRDTRNEINGLTMHSTSLPSDNLGGGGGGLHDYDDPIDPFQNHDKGTTNNNNSNNKWWKTLYFMFGLVSVLGMIGLGSIATSHCTLDIRCTYLLLRLGFLVEWKAYKH